MCVSLGSLYPGGAMPYSRCCVSVVEVMVHSLSGTTRLGAVTKQSRLVASGAPSAADSSPPIIHRILTGAPDCERHARPQQRQRELVPHRHEESIPPMHEQDCPRHVD